MLNFAVKCSCFSSGSKNTPDDKHMVMVSEKTYVRVVGRIVDIVGERQFIAFCVDPLSDMNALTTHILEVYVCSICSRVSCKICPNVRLDTVEIKTATQMLEKIVMAATVSSGSDVKWRMNFIRSETKHVIKHLIDTNVRLDRMEQASTKQVNALRVLCTLPRVISSSYEVQDCTA